MRGDREVADARPVGQNHRHGRLGAAVAAPGFEEVGDGAGAQRVAAQRDLDGRGELLRPIVIEQGEQPNQMRPEHVAALRQAGKQRRGNRHGQAQAIAGAGRIRLLGGREEPVEMRRVLDRVPAVVAAPVPRDLVGARDDPDSGRAGQERERAADVGVGN